MMTAKITYITLGSYRYPMVMSLYTIQKLEERFGGLENAEKAMDESNSEQIGLVIDLLHMLIESGTEYLNQVGKHPDGCDLDELGNIRLISKKGVSACLIGMSGIENATKMIRTVFENANVKQIKAVTKQTDGKAKKKKKRSIRKIDGSMCPQGQ